VTREQVREAAQSLLVRRQRTVGVLVPTQAAEPETADAAR
jgi:hypothetical protein